MLVKYWRMRVLFVAALLLVCTSAGADVTGIAKVVDSDRLIVDGHRYFLWGIDAPELNQLCVIDGQVWECGPAAARKLEELVSLGPITCSERRDTDRRRRVYAYAVCEFNGMDINEALVRAGMAMAFREQADDYAAAEEAAMNEGVGMWRGQFETPWEYRDNLRN